MNSSNADTEPELFSVRETADYVRDAMAQEPSRFGLSNEQAPLATRHNLDEPAKSEAAKSVADGATTASPQSLSDACGIFCIRNHSGFPRRECRPYRRECRPPTAGNAAPATFWLGARCRSAASMVASTGPAGVATRSAARAAACRPPTVFGQTVPNCRARPCHRQYRRSGYRRHSTRRRRSIRENMRRDRAGAAPCTERRADMSTPVIRAKVARKNICWLGFSQPIAGDFRIAVLSIKGGVGKTTTTLGLGSVLALVRSDRVIAVDANPDRGTLAERIHDTSTNSTVRDLLMDSNINGYADIRGHTRVAASRLEVLASEQDPAAADVFGEADYRRTIEILGHRFTCPHRLRHRHYALRDGRCSRIGALDRTGEFAGRRCYPQCVGNDGMAGAAWPFEPGSRRVRGAEYNPGRLIRAESGQSLRVL